MSSLLQIVVMGFSFLLPVALIAAVWAYAAKRRRYLDEDDE